jgi:hypothetical protein
MSLKRIGDVAPNINVSDPTYSADQIVGRTLIAKTQVTAYDEPEDGSNVVNSFAPGQTVGVVTSWEDANAALGISVLNWQFMDANGTPYYVPHYVGEFDIQALADSGALTTGQQTQAAIDANKPAWQLMIQQYAPWIIGGVLAIGLVGVLLKNSGKKS